MAANDMKTRITLDGEKEYNSAIKSAQQELKRLRTELKAESAELKANGKENETAAKKQESLKKQIQEQEKIVATLKKALSEAKESYGDNADVVAKWENKLNEARATLANMQTDLKGLGDSFKAADNGAAMGTVATKSFADALGSISGVGETISAGIESIFKSMVDTISDAVGRLFDEVMALADKANQWTDLAGFWGTSTTEIEKWSHAVEGSHNGFEQLTGAIRRFALGGKEDTIAEALGISKEGKSDWDYGIACMRELYRLSHDEGKNLDDLYSQIFGERKAEGVMDLINDWATIEDNLKVFDVENGGVGMTQEQLDDMSTLAEQVSLIEQKWSAFKDSFIAGAVGKLGLELSEDANGILDHFIAFMDSKDQTELDAMVAEVQKFFEDLSAGIAAGIASINEVGKALMDSDDPTTQAIGKIVTKISEALEWLANSENWGKIESCLKGFFDLWLVGKGAEALGAIAQLAANIKVIGGFGGGLNLLGGGGGTTSATGLAGLMGGGTLATIAGSVAYLAPIALLINGIASNVRDIREGKHIQEEKEEHYQEGIEQGYDKVDQIGQQWEQFARGVTEAESGTTEFNRMYEGWNTLKGGGEDAWFSNLYTGVSQGVRDKMDEMFGDYYTMSLWNDSGAYNDQKIEFVNEVMKDLEDQINASRTTGSFLTADQEQAMQSWWDAYRADTTGDTWDEQYNAMVEAFGGEDSPLFSAVYDLIEAFEQEYNNGGNEAYSIEDLPSLWFNQQLSGMGITNTQAQSLDGAIKAMPGAVSKAVSGLQVSMNAAIVGRIIAPYVSEYIAEFIE